MGQPICVPYEAPQGRRINVLGAYFSHGPLAGRFVSTLYATLPKSKAKKHRKTPAQIAEAHGLTADQVGPIDAARFLSFVWRVAGRPTVYWEGWQRRRPLALVLDNYSVHASIQVQEALPELAAANVHLFFLPSYSPELSQIEPIWQSVKHHEMAKRSFSRLGELKAAVVEALTRKAKALLNTQRPKASQREKDQRQKGMKFLPLYKTDNLLYADT